MKTLDMMNEAAKTGKTYINLDMRYSVEKGFFDCEGKPWVAGAFETINDIMSLNKWKLLPITTPIKMTLKEIEDKLGYKVELISG